MEENQEIEIESIGHTFQFHTPSSSFGEECERALAGSDNFYYRSKTAKFSYTALLFGPFYYLYRKMYIEGLFLMLVLSVLPVPPQFSVVVWLIEGLAFYPLYRNHANKKINKILQRYSDIDSQSQLDLIRAKGGVNYFIAVLFAAFYFMLMYYMLTNM